MENGRFGSGFFSCDPEINPLTSSNQWLQQDVAALSRIKQRGHFLCNIPGRVIIVGHDVIPLDFLVEIDFIVETSRGKSELLQNHGCG